MLFSSSIIICSSTTYSRYWIRMCFSLFNVVYVYCSIICCGLVYPCLAWHPALTKNYRNVLHEYKKALCQTIVYPSFSDCSGKNPPISLPQRHQYQFWFIFSCFLFLNSLCVYCNDCAALCVLNWLIIETKLFSGRFIADFFRSSCTEDAVTHCATLLPETPSDMDPDPENFEAFCR